MAETKTGFSKDEEKDINLLITRVKKTPQLFKDRILAKLKEFSQLFTEIKAAPNQKNADFSNLCMFFAQIYEFYPLDLRPLLESLIQLFEQSGPVLHPLLRYKIIQTLIVIKKKGFINFFKSFDFFVSIFGYPDKQLRGLVFEHMASFLRSMSVKKDILKKESELLACFTKSLASSSPEIGRRLIKLLTKLYMTRVWCTVKSANLIASKIVSGDEKTSMMVARFLIASTEAVIKEEADDEEDNDNFAEIKKQYSLKNKFSKKKIEKLERQMKNIKKKEERMEKLVTNSNVYPIDLLYNPSSFVDQLYGKLMKDKNMKFLLKQEIMCLLGRLIGRNKLIYPNYYNYVFRFVKPELKTPERLFAFIAESVHTSSPLLDVEQLCKKFVDMFVCEGNSEEKIIVGINFLRLVMTRNELALNTEQINQIAGFRTLKSKHVSAASKAFINVIRDLCPDQLDKEFHVYNFKGELDVRVERRKDVVDRVEGADLLKQDKGGVDVENLRVFTEEDFRKIRKLKSKKAMKKMEEFEEEKEAQKRAIHMPTVDVLEERRKFIRGEGDLKEYGEDEIEALVNDPNYEGLLEELEGMEVESGNDEDGDEVGDQEDIEDDEDEEEVDEDEEEDGDEEDGDEEDEDEDDEDEEEVDEDEEEVDEDEEGDIKEDESNRNVVKSIKKVHRTIVTQPVRAPKFKKAESSSSEDEEDEDDDDIEENFQDYDTEMQKRGFVTENMLNTKKSQKEIKAQTQMQKFEQILQRKYLFKKNQKKGSSTNTDKLKCKPAMMIVEKLRFEKQNVSAAKKRIRKGKNFVGRPTRYDMKKPKKQ